MKKLAMILTVFCGALALHAAEVNPAEAKLREGLKNTMIQLRNVQTEKDALVTAKADLEAQVAALTEKVEKIEKQLADDKMAADKRIAELTDRVVARGNEVMQAQQEIEKWKKSQQEAAALAAKKEGDRARLASEKIVLERKVADQRTKNAEMFKIGNEILTRYEKFGIGSAITAREPFVGLTRVKFQNLVQDYGDKLADQKIKP
jgi:DNA repair exonuclease SbcCD ATPase subunit